MNNQPKELPSYLVEAYVFDTFGNKIKIDGSTTKDKCELVLAKSNNRRYPFKHNICSGKGYLLFDDGKVFFDKNNKRQTFTSWVRTCDCVNKIVDKSENFRNILLG